MSLDKYASATEKRIATQLVTELLADGYRLSVNNGGDDNEIPFTDDAETILDTLAATGEDRLLCQIDGKAAGFVLLVYGNDDELIADYSTRLSSIVDNIS